MKKEFIIERQGKSFVLYAGLLEEAHEQGLKEISTSLIQLPSPDNGNVAVCQASVQTDKGRFSGLGDASPGNVSPLMQQHLIRMAETRAKARALRDAVNVGVAALEELAEDDSPASRATETASSVTDFEVSGGSWGTAAPQTPRLRGVTARDQSREELKGGESGEPRSLGSRTATDKQLKAIYAIAQNTQRMSKAEVDTRCQDMYGYAPQDLSRGEASQFIDLLKQDKVA